MNALDRVRNVDGVVYVSPLYNHLSFPVTAMFTDCNACNEYLEKHKDEGMILESGKYLFCASNDVEGIDLPRE